THYIYSAYDTRRDGPIVLEVPPAVGAGLYGQLCDMWDVPLAIVGPGGDDKGQGGKFVLFPPDYQGNTPDRYIPIRPQTYGGFWLMRTIAKSRAQADEDAAIALLKKLRVYPLSKAGNPPCSVSSMRPAKCGMAFRAWTRVSMQYWPKWWTRSRSI